LPSSWLRKSEEGVEMSNDILKDIKEEELYKVLGKSLNDYIDKNPLPPVRLVRVLLNLQLQITNRASEDRK